MLWDDLKVFLAVQRHGSHKGAARELGVDPTTVARRLTALETTLAKKLLVRTPERLLPTPAGAALATRAERIESEILASERELAGSDPSLDGPLRVTAGDGLVHYVLLPALSELRRLHPSLELELRADTRVLDLSRREADLAVRLVRPKEPALVTRRLGVMQLGLFASRAYLERHGAPRSLSAVAQHSFIGFDAALDGLPQVKWLKKSFGEPRYVLRANGTTAQVLACAEGHGIALLPEFTARREARLVRLLPRLIGPARELYGVVHAEMRGNARVSAAMAWISSAIQSTDSGAA